MCYHSFTQSASWFPIAIILGLDGDYILEADSHMENASVRSLVLSEVLHLKYQRT